MNPTPIHTMSVDDEPMARKAISHLLAGDSDVRLCGEYGDGAAALAAMVAQKPQLVFLDVQMPGMNGFEVLNQLRGQLAAVEMPHVIFVTAYDRYALKAFEYHAVDYLLKPFSDARFYAALAQAKHQIGLVRKGQQFGQIEALLSGWRGLNPAETAARNPSSGLAGRLIVKGESEAAVISWERLMFLEAAGHYVVVHSVEGQHITRDTLARLIELLPVSRFCQVHRSYVVNGSFVDVVRHFGKDCCEIQLHNNKRIPVSRRRQSAVRKWLGFA